MNLRKLTLGLVPILALSSCEDHTQPVTVTETRRLTKNEDIDKFFAVMPSEWRRVPSTKFRDFNCKFGESGEVYVSLASGEVKTNAERWLKQFDDQSTVNVNELETLSAFGAEGYLLEAEGKFAGMRGVSIDNAALLGFLVPTEGSLVTVKMVGEADKVKAQREAFMQFCKSLKWK